MKKLIFVTLLGIINHSAVQSWPQHPLETSSSRSSVQTSYEHAVPDSPTSTITHKSTPWKLIVSAGTLAALYVYTTYKKMHNEKPFTLLTNWFSRSQSNKREDV